MTFTFAGQDRNLYAFHSVAHDAAGNTESKSSTAIEASTSVPDLNPPVTHILASSPSYSWGPFPSSEFSGLTPSSYSNGVFTLNWAGADPDQNSGIPAGSIALVNIYVEIDGGTPTLIGQLNGGTPNGNGVYTGSMTYNALGDGQSHTYSFFSVGIDDQQKTQYAPAGGAGRARRDVQRHHLHRPAGGSELRGREGHRGALLHPVSRRRFQPDASSTEPGAASPGERADRQQSQLVSWNSCGTARTSPPAVLPRAASTSSTPAPPPR